MNRLLLLLLLITSSTSAFSFVNGNYPLTPDKEISPGRLCTENDPDFRRFENHGYGEVAICIRNVSTRMKYQIVTDYGIPASDRKQYKIDHIIPLSIGGSNHPTNLFPIFLGHDDEVTSVYERPERYACDGFRDGRFSQEEAVKMIRDWKYGGWLD